MDQELATNLFQLVGGGVDLSNDNGFVILVLSAQLVPDGGQALAVSAPRCVEFNEDGLRFIESNSLEVLADQDLEEKRKIWYKLYCHQTVLLVSRTVKQKAHRVHISTTPTLTGFLSQSSGISSDMRKGLSLPFK